MIILKIANGRTMHDVRDDERQVIGYISDAKNAVGTLDFDIYPKHPAYTAIKAGSTKIRAYRDGVWLHDYTVESVTNDLQLKKHVTATDELQYLERIEVPSYKTGVDGVPQTVSGFFMWLIEYYNARSGGERFAFGQIEGDIIDTTTTLDRSSDSPATVASIVKDKIIDSLGGYVRVRRVDGVLTIDLKADAAGVCKQYIEFGENLVDYADEQDASELYTAVTAESKYKDDNGDEVTITLADAPDGDYLTGYAKQGDTVTNTAAATTYGVRRKHLSFDGINDVYTLVENCEKYIAAHCEPVTTVNVSAADLSTLDSNVQSFDVGLYTRVKAAPMGFDAAFECQSAKRSLNDPTDDKYTLGWTWNSLSSLANKQKVEAALGIGQLYQSTEEIDQIAKDASQVATAAVDIANTADSSAQAAQSAAANADEKAETAQGMASSAAKTATDYLGFSADGLEVGYDGSDSRVLIRSDGINAGVADGGNLDIAADSVTVKNGEAMLASFFSRSGKTNLISPTTPLYLYAGSADDPQSVFLTVPPQSDGTESDVGLGVVYDADVGRFSIYGVAQSAELYLNNGLSINGRFSQSGEILFDDDNNAIGASVISLSGNVTDYDRITICYRSNDAQFASIDVWRPLGKRVSLQTSNGNSNGLYIKGKTMTIGESSISIYNANDGSGDWFYEFDAKNGSLNHNNVITITQVIGWK